MDDDVPSHAVISGADLYIENLNKSFNGTYRCTAANALGESFDDYVLYVYGRPERRRLQLHARVSVHMERPVLVVLLGFEVRRRLLLQPLVVALRSAAPPAGGGGHDARFPLADRLTAVRTCDLWNQLLPLLP